MESITQQGLTFIQEARKIAWRRDGQSKFPDWNEELWIEVPYHWEGDTKVYHSHVDYCDD